jgi:hypothetical protein
MSFVETDGVVMSKFLSIFGVVVFLYCLYLFVTFFFSNDREAAIFYGSIFGMLNASIAIAVSEILNKVKTTKS